MSIKWYSSQKGDLFQGPRVGSCLTLGNELSEETHVLTKQETLLGRGARAVREQQGKGTQENCSAMGLTVSCFMAMGLAFWVVSGQSSCPCPYLLQFKALPQSRWFPVWVFQKGWQDIWWAGVSSLLLAPPKLSWLVFGGSTMFLIGTSCCETTHASGYYRAWPRRVVSVNGSLIVLLLCSLCKRENRHRRVKWFVQVQITSEW